MLRAPSSRGRGPCRLAGGCVCFVSPNACTAWSVFATFPLAVPAAQREELAKTAAQFSGAPRLAVSSTIQAAAASAIRPVEGLVRGASKSTAVAAAATGGRLSEWELYKLAQVFKGMDKDKSGCLSREELVAGLANAEGTWGPPLCPP